MDNFQFNSMPENRTFGARDVSVPTPIYTARTKPSHLPVWFLFAEWGPLGRQMADGAIRKELYGDATFDVTSKFYTHQTKFSDVVNATGNQCIYQRVVADNASQAAIRLWIDYITTQVPEYQRGTDGRYLLDEAGAPIPTGNTIEGIIEKIVATPIDAQHGGDFGQASQMVGDQVDANTSTQSVRKAIMDIPAQFLGARGNTKGFRMWAPVEGARVEADSELLQKNKAYPFVVSCMDNYKDTIQKVQTKSGVNEITVVFAPDQVKASVGEVMSFDPRFDREYNDTDRAGMAPLYGPFGKVHVYQDNLKGILKEMYDLESQYIDPFSDFTGEGDDEIYRVNFLSAKTSRNTPYHSIIINRTDANAQPMSDISTIWLEGGADGDLDNETFNDLVGAEMRKYGSVNNEIAENRLGNPESIFWDSGFNVDTKEDLLNIIAVRKDTMVVLTTHVHGGATLTASQESSLATALFTKAQMLPESTEYGTAAMRCAIVAGDGELISDPYLKRLPLSLELAKKAGEMMGAGDGKWKPEFSFSNGRRAELSMFKNINVGWRPITMRRNDWNNGMVYVQSKDIGLYFFPAFRTVYPVQNSILTSWFTAMGFVDLQKVADRVWADFTGNDDLTNEQFKKYVEQACQQQTDSKYGDRFLLNFNVVFTAVDEYNGFSWTLYVDIGAEPQKTVQLTILSGYRREVLASQLT